MNAAGGNSSWGAEVREVGDQLSQRCDGNKGQRSWEVHYRKTFEGYETAKEGAAPTTINVPMAVEADVEPCVKDGVLRRAGPRSVKLLQVCQHHSALTESLEMRKKYIISDEM